MLLNNDSETTRIADVYCDSDQTLNRVIQIHPSSEGLYPHEVAMLFFVRFGSYTTEKRHYSGIWKYQFGVTYPDALLFSLVSRGYVRECTKSELPDYMKIDVLRRILKTKSIRPGKTKKEAIQKVRENFLENEYVELCGFYYYVLTEEGKKAIEKQPEDIALDATKAWNIFIQDKSQPILDKESIKLQKKDHYELHYCSRNNDVEMYVKDEHIKHYYTRSNWFDETVSLDVYIDDAMVYTAQDLNLIIIFSDNTRIIVGRVIKTEYIKTRENEKREKLNGVTFHSYIEHTKCNEYCECTEFDLINGIPLFTETVLREDIDNLESIKYSEKYGFMRKGNESNVHFYFSTCNAISDIVISKYFSRFLPVKKIDPFVQTEAENNYEVVVSKTDENSLYMFLYLIKEKAIAEPTILGCSLTALLRYLLIDSKSELQNTLVNDCFQKMYSAKDVAERLLSSYSNKKEELISAIENVFILENGIVTPNDLHMNIQLGKNPYHYVINHKDDLYKKFTKILLALKEEGLINVRWINEFSLFHLVQKRFQNAEYQKRFDWLGMQSLDIYIPDCNTGIEYQGEQHYAPVDFFGGQDSYEQTLERDLRKRKLCEEHGVKLLEWKYTTEVSQNNVDKFIQENDLKKQFQTH